METLGRSRAIPHRKVARKTGEWSRFEWRSETRGTEESTPVNFWPMLFEHGVGGPTDHASWHENSADAWLLLFLLAVDHPGCASRTSFAVFTGRDLKCQLFSNYFLPRDFATNGRNKASSDRRIQAAREPLR